MSKLQTFEIIYWNKLAYVLTCSYYIFNLFHSDHSHVYYNLNAVTSLAYYNHAAATEGLQKVLFDEVIAWQRFTKTDNLQNQACRKPVKRFAIALNHKEQFWAPRLVQQIAPRNLHSQFPHPRDQKTRLGLQKMMGFSGYSVRNVLFLEIFWSLIGSRTMQHYSSQGR